MTLIDTHCHLTYAGLLEQQAAVVQRAKAAGVGAMVTIGTHPPDHALVLQTLASFDCVAGALGVHPHHAGEVSDDFAAALELQIAAAPRVVAVGECGLDYHFYPPAECARQRPVFVRQLEIARRLNKPVILHVRDAHADACAIMRDFTDLKFVVHCFTGTPDECAGWLELGAYVGITGVVTYKNAPDVRAAARLVPPDRLLVETDAPYLSPQPVRKIKINEPAFVTHVAQRVAAERGVDELELARQTTRNAAAFFGENVFAVALANSDMS